MEQAQGVDIPVLEQLARREQQLEQLRGAYVELQQRQIQNNNINMDRMINSVSHLPIFTGHGDITINSFLSSTEYLLSTLETENQRREITRAIYYRTIQGEAKDTIINLPQPDSWDQIKQALKLRYKPDVEPYQLYRRINSLRANNVSDLAVEIQKIKHKADELMVYYRGDVGVDLTNINSLLTNTIKEITQGVLLDKIYEEHNLETIINIMTRRRYEDSCIRQEFKKNRAASPNIFKLPNKYPNRNRFHDNNLPDRSYNQNREYRGQYSGQFRLNQPNFNNTQYQNQDKERYSNQVRRTQPNFNNVQYQNQNRENYSNQVRRHQQYFNKNYQSNRSGQFRRNQEEPMEVDNIEVGYNRPQRAENPNQYCGQDGWGRIGRSQGGPSEDLEEVNNTIFFMKQPQRDYPK